MPVPVCALLLLLALGIAVSQVYPLVEEEIKSPDASRRSFEEPDKAYNHSELIVEHREDNGYGIYCLDENTVLPL